MQSIWRSDAADPRECTVSTVLRHWAEAGMLGMGRVTPGWIMLLLGVGHKPGKDASAQPLS